MKSIINKLALFIVALGFVSCEEVIDLDLKTGEPILVVEGNIDFSPENIKDTVSVKLTTTTGYYEKEIPKVHNAKVWVEDSKGTKYPLIEKDNSGIYISTEVKKDFVNSEYKLHVEHEGQIYEAEEKLVSTPEIIKVTQTKEKIFGDDYYAIRFHFQDTPQSDNSLNYYFRNIISTKNKPWSSIFSNEFTKGNKMESIIIDKDYKVGDTITIEFQQISRTYFDFMNAVYSNSSNGGGPFQVPIAKIKGNVKNITTVGKDAKGYFRITEKRTVKHTIVEQ
ncbi:MAG: DUF4249 domain-containing protein [Flavobacteriaceae bacterium]|jgi:hypothetical protein|nr:DUF4249 domain-containing protein [Flavobacteriaceae bacterium]